MPFEFKDGDRIVWIGNTLVEREQRYGYWESALLAANADKKLTFRNLGWSGDTVFGDARAGFENAAKGFERLVALTLELKPTVILVSYGTNESFEGKDGLARFENGMRKLLDALAPSKARIILMSPIPFEKCAGLVEPTKQNANLALYSNAIKSIASERKLAFVDLFERINRADSKYKSNPLTENGMHLSDRGYLVTANCLLDENALRSESGIVALQNNRDLINLRKAVVEKNQLFFYRWRPQNETYLFGFRKQEQGRNAKEVAEFDPLVSKAEEEIDKILKTLAK